MKTIHYLNKRNKNHIHPDNDRTELLIWLRLRKWINIKIHHLSRWIVSSSYSFFAIKTGFDGVIFQSLWGYENWNIRSRNRDYIRHIREKAEKNEIRCYEALHMLICALFIRLIIHIRCREIRMQLIPEI